MRYVALPWSEIVLDLSAYAIDPEKLVSDKWRLPRQLHRQLAAGHRGSPSRQPIAAGALIKSRGWRAACSTSAFPHGDHPADMPDRSELGHEAT